MSKPRVTCSVEVLAHIDASKPVQVYRNLHVGCLSVRQGGIVRCHVDNIVLNHATFIVSQKGRDKVRMEQKKNVHAYVRGRVTDAHICRNLLWFPWDEVRYNPYTCEHFMSGEDEIDCAEWVDIDGSPSQIVPAILALNLGYRKHV
jgi:hypothetical protein